MHRLHDADTGAIVVPDLEIATVPGLRSARGLLGRRALAPGHGLLLADPLRCVHTIGMRFPIDVVFLDRRLRVVGIARHVPPRRLAWCRRGRLQLELAAGGAASRGIPLGARLRVERGEPRGHGGRVAPGSPRVPIADGKAAHRTSPAPCTGRRDRPTIPPAAAGADGATP